MSSGWLAMMQQKVGIIIEAYKASYGEIFIFCDVDVQFFSRTEAILKEKIEGKDLVIQRDGVRGEPNTGFFIARSNDRSLRMWEDIRERMMKVENRLTEQKILKEILVSRRSRRLMDSLNQRVMFSMYLDVSNLALLFSTNQYGLKWSYLPEAFFTPGLRQEQIWSPSDEIDIPRNIVLHHANWTVGVENKIAQLQYVREVVLSRLKAK
jgi:hypothetical protein